MLFGRGLDIIYRLPNSPLRRIGSSRASTIQGHRLAIIPGVRHSACRTELALASLPSSGSRIMARSRALSQALG
jgi:hypothetical protein